MKVLMRTPCTGVCVDCPADKYSTTNNDIACEDCPTGKWTNLQTNQSECEILCIGSTAPAAPVNGALGSCETSLGLGRSCQPVCNVGYFVSSASTCHAGTMTDATCAACDTKKGQSTYSGWSITSGE